MATKTKPKAKQEEVKISKKQSIFWDKYNGMSYQDLSIKYTMNQFTLYHAFAKGGKWVEEYGNYADELNRESIKTAKRILKSGVEPATKVLLKHLNNPEGHIAIKAAKEVLDREFGKPKETHKHEGSMGLSIMEVARIVAEQGKEREDGGAESDVGTEDSEHSESD